MVDPDTLFIFGDCKHYSEIASVEIGSLFSDYYQVGVVRTPPLRPTDLICSMFCSY